MGPCGHGNDLHMRVGLFDALKVFNDVIEPKEHASLVDQG